MSSHLGTQENEAKALHPRIMWLQIIIAISGVVLFGRLWYLQIMRGQDLRSYSEKNRIKSQKTEARRGVLLDREGRVLVDTVNGFRARISPQYATKLPNSIEPVSGILGMEPDEILKKVKRGRSEYGPFRRVVIKENISQDERTRLDLLKFDHPGVFVDPALVRSYPLGDNGAQLFGYVSEINQKQIDSYNKKYGKLFHFEQGDKIGKSGIEEAYEKYIRGNDGLEYIEVDARGRESSRSQPELLGQKFRPRIPGNNLVLTIDRDIQMAAYNAINRDDSVGARSGSVVVMRSNGEILAWVSAPSFNPNEFSYGISRESWRKLANDPLKPLRNKVIQDHYPPGSTFKPIVALAALQEKVITPETIVASPGVLYFSKRPYHDHRRAGHGNINIYQALERSSNVFFYKMGIELGINNIAKYAKALGFGSKTNIGFDIEVPGTIPTEEWKQKTIGEPWQPGENLSNAIGQGFVLSTVLQQAVAFNAVALEGKVYQPFIVKKIIDHESNLIKEFSPVLVRDLSDKENNEVYIDKKNFKVVKEGMRLVVQGEHGTARRARVAGVEIGGKTGTAQVRRFSKEEIYKKCSERVLTDRHHGIFVAFAPVEKPEISIAVLAEHSCSGSRGAAPIAKDIIQAYMDKYHPERLTK